MRICVYEDAEWSGLEPLTSARPTFDLRCGASSLLERQIRCFAADEVGVLVRPMLADLCRLAIRRSRSTTTPGCGAAPQSSSTLAG